MRPAPLQFVPASVNNPGVGTSQRESDSREGKHRRNDKCQFDRLPIQWNAGGICPIPHAGPPESWIWIAMHLERMKTNKRVLIIDEDPEYRSQAMLALRREYLVSVAADGAAGFFKAVEFPPDLVVLEVLMANWSGMRTLQAFRNHPTLKKVPIVMVSTDASRATVIAAVQNGADDYVLKTAQHLEELPRKISRLLDRPSADEQFRTVPPPASHIGHAPSSSPPLTADQQSIIDGWE